MGWVVKATSRPLYPGKESVPIVQEAGWASGPVWTGEENLAPTGIRSPDRPASIESLYRLRYLGPIYIYIYIYIYVYIYTYIHIYIYVYATTVYTSYICARVNAFFPTYGHRYDVLFALYF